MTSILGLDESGLKVTVPVLACPLVLARAWIRTDAPAGRLASDMDVGETVSQDAELDAQKWPVIEATLTVVAPPSHGAVQVPGLTEPGPCIARNVERPPSSAGNRYTARYTTWSAWNSWKATTPVW
jgi:hypothetical protein